MEYKLIPADRYDDVIDHLRNTFFADEPLNKAAGLCRPGVGNRELEHHSLETLSDGLSLMAIDEDGRIAGVILNGILRPGDTERALAQLELSSDDNFKKIFELLYTHGLQSKLFSRFGVDRAFDVRILSVDARFRGQGIAKELVRRSERVARDCGFPIMKADATGIFSQKILRSNGFEMLSEQLYGKYTDAQGQIILPVEAPHIKLQLLYKRLDENEADTEAELAQQ
ncbi:dopamine N-acetyltransferase [Scaptodrosophila lebanonensis]|uniref:aralkylamine N-acetyltransferase n=1 Tax=Drosophila lebanonensis TaxID=7225 RepID=A0A6J2TT94_DROLE|nr:dopamine N-acetyltransferase [Scaptodrosophila lebanonensis]